MSRLNVVIGADIKQLETNFNKAVKLVQESGDGMSAERIGTGPKALRFSPKGPGIPEGMMAKGPSAHWENQARARLGPRIAHELTAILLGYAPGARK